MELQQTKQASSTSLLSTISWLVMTLSLETEEISPDRWFKNWPTWWTLKDNGLFLDIQLAICEIPQGLIQGPPLFINNVNGDAGHSISKVVVDNQGAWLTQWTQLQSRGTQKKLRTWLPDAFSKEKYKVLHWEQHNPVCQYRQGKSWLITTLLKRTWD